MNSADSTKLLVFFHLCEKLKTERRFSKTSDGENDRVAAHSWRMAVMLIFLAPYLKKDINLLKVLKLAIIHDLPEAIVGDQPYFKHMFNEDARLAKEKKEKQAILKINSQLPFVNKDELLQLWEEYEARISYEAKVVRAIDKIEAQIQHNEADISVWNEYDRKYYATFLNEFCDFDPALQVFRHLVQNESKEKLQE